MTQATIAILIARVQHLSSLEIHRLSTEMTLLMDEEVDHAIQLKHNERELGKKLLKYFSSKLISSSIFSSDSFSFLAMIGNMYLKSS